jgi:hypothetical protein
MNIKLEYYDYCNDCFNKIKNILTINLLSLHIDILNIILSKLNNNDTIILDNNYKFISTIIHAPITNFKLPFVLGCGKPLGFKGPPNEVKSFNFVNKLLQKSDIASLFTLKSLLWNRNKYYKTFRKELINKNKLEYIVINVNLSYSSTNMILLIYKPYEITTNIKIINYENTNLIKTINANDIINNNYMIYI